MDSLKFGTSGLRGLVTDLDGPAAHAWTRAFLQHLDASGQAGSRDVMIGRDLRASSPAIASRVAAAIGAFGWLPVDLGALPTPALALAAGARDAAAVMVTGSHIPDDRNGLKFYAPKGEIDKTDESGIRHAYHSLAEADLSCEERIDPGSIASAGAKATEDYLARYIAFFGRDALSGLTVGIYEQSSVARDILGEILERLGARTESLARSDAFIPVDTEAHRPEDIALIAGWGETGRFDAIVSTDGDGDRPLVADERGRILRGDVLGLVSARHLSLSTIVTPVTSTSAIERSGFAAHVERTRVGSPFVIAGIERMLAAGRSDVIGFEANGGVLTGSPARRDGRQLSPLKTRDAVLPILCVLAEAAERRQPVSRIAAGLKAGFTAAGRLKEVSAERSRPFLETLAADEAYRRELVAPLGPVRSHDALDGVRMILEDGRVVHFRASGNAPELRCYVEAADQDEADRLLVHGLAAAERAVS